MRHPTDTVDPALGRHSNIEPDAALQPVKAYFRRVGEMMSNRTPNVEDLTTGQLVQF